VRTLRRVPRCRRSIEAYLHRPGEELYDICRDPDEVVNLAASPAHQKTLAAMRAEVHAWRRKTRDPCGPSSGLTKAKSRATRSKNADSGWIPAGRRAEHPAKTGPTLPCRGLNRPYAEFRIMPSKKRVRRRSRGRTPLRLGIIRGPRGKRANRRMG